MPRLRTLLRSRPATLLAPAVREELVSLQDVLRDGWRYQRASCTDERLSDPSQRAARHEARLTMAYHRVEKALALPQPKRPFGMAARRELQDLLASDHGHEEPYSEYGRTALAALDSWNEQEVIDDQVTFVIADSRSPVGAAQLGELFSSRSSLRNFDTAAIPTQSKLAEAVELARNTPSVCNRQAFRVHFFQDQETIADLLRLQGGATGFAQTVPTLAVVTVKRGLFVGPFERNQRWVDGGLFAMTLVWALHGLQLGTCMLNWAKSSSKSDRLRAAAGIPVDEDVVVLVAIGRAVQGARAARSHKRTVEELATFH